MATWIMRSALAGLMNQFGEPLYRKVEPTGYSNRGAEWMNSASLIARMNFGMALARGNVPGVKVDTTQFSLDASRIEAGRFCPDRAFGGGANRYPDRTRSAGIRSHGGRADARVAGFSKALTYDTQSQNFPS